MKFSIITVCYNSENTIEKTIKSILSQNYKNFEYIIVDGGSTDNTMKIINNFKDNIHLIISEKDKGIYDAINKGIKISSGDIISIIHSDDIYFDDNILGFVNSYFDNNQDLDCLIGSTLIKKNHNNSIIRKYNPTIFKTWMLYLGFSPPHPSTFMKKEIYDKYGYYKTDYEIAGDFEFFLRIFNKNKIVYKLLKKIFVTMSFGGKSTKSIKSNIVSSKEILKSFKENKIYSNWFLISMRFPIKLIQILIK